MFYGIFAELCKQKGVTPTEAGRDNNIQQGTISMWKKRGSTPNAVTMTQLADYFGVSVDYLLTGDESKRNPNLILGDNTAAILDEIDALGEDAQEVKSFFRDVLDNLDEPPTGLTEADAEDIAAYIQFVKERRKKRQDHA